MSAVSPVTTVLYKRLQLFSVSLWLNTSAFLVVNYVSYERFKSKLFFIESDRLNSSQLYDFITLLVHQNLSA